MAALVVSAKAASVNAVAMNLIRLVIFLPPNDSLPSNDGCRFLAPGNITKEDSAVVMKM
jgi:hypothetical protein